MAEMWRPPIPHCITLMQARDNLTIRDTPSALGRSMGIIPAGMVVRVDRNDYCRLYGTKYRYIRLVSWNSVPADEPLYIVWQEVSDTGVIDWLALKRDDCEETPDEPETPEDNLSDLVIELEFQKMNAVLPLLHEHFGTEQFKARLTPEVIAVFQEVIVGATTPDVEPPVVTPPAPEPVPDIPPVEEIPPTPAPTPVPESALTPFRVENNQILKDGRVWKGMGMNFRELAYYGLGVEPVKWARDEHVAMQLDGAANKQASVIRVYCAHHAFNVEQAIPRVKHILDEAHKRGLYVILVLTDGAPAGQFYVADTPENKQGRYTWKWIEGGYRGKYWEFVDKLTQALGSHPAVWSWEPINELTAPIYPLTSQQSEAMLDFWRQVTNLIRKNAPAKLISNGNISCWELFVLDAYGGGEYAEKMARLPNLDIMCFHSYTDSPNPLGGTHEHIANEVNLLRGKVKKVAFILEETATVWTDDFVETSSDPLKRQAEAILPMGIALIMLWGVSFPYGQNIGVGDKYFNDNKEPLSTRWHNVMGWFEAMAKQFKQMFS